jgi:hypothetical protein
VGAEHISTGKKVKGKRNKTPHEPKIGLGLSNEELKAAWDKEQKKKQKE